MIKLVKLDGKVNYLYNPITRAVINKFSDINNIEDICCIISLDENQIHGDISLEYGGQYVMRYGTDKYILDDGYQNVLIKAGYMVYQNYDNDRIEDINDGKKINDFILENIKEKSNSILDCMQSNLNYEYIVTIDSVNNVVAKNHRRRDNGLSFYPFDKNMDKFGSVYVMIFAKKNSDVDDSYNKYAFPDNYIKNLVSSLGAEYHFIGIPIKNRIVYSEDL